MKAIFLPILICVVQLGFAQTKIKYLSKNKFDLYSPDFHFPQRDFKIIGFGATHGSSKTEEAEIILLKSVIQNCKIKYYIPETDFSTAHFFNEYLTSGDTILLKDLVYHYGYIPSQERSIETYNKWKQLKLINDKLREQDKIQIIGLDVIASYKYTVKHLLELMNIQHINLKSAGLLTEIIKTDTVDYLSYHKSYLKSVLQGFVSEYELNKSQIDPLISNHFLFSHILNSVKMTLDINSAGRFWNQDRDKIFFDNYMNLFNYFQMNSNPQFCRYGFGHLPKSRMYPQSASFLAQLIENKIYSKNEVIAVIGFLKNSEVLNVNYSKNGSYLNYTATADSLDWDGKFVHFKAIENLVQNRLSDLTLYRLNEPDSPYSADKVDFIQMLSSSKPPEPDDKNFIGKVSTDFLDYALLISNSASNIPIEELK